MKVRTKLILLLSLLVFIFLIIFILFRNNERKTLVFLFQNESKEKGKVFDKLLMLKGKSLETLAYDYTYWDEMTDFIATADKAWSEKMMDTNVLSNYGTNAIWIYGLNLSLLYSVNNLSDAGFRGLSLPKEVFEKLYLKRFCHFFINTPEGLMEMRGATVHPTADTQRKSPPRGYFFTARLWNKDYLAELSELTGSPIVVTPVLQRTPVGNFDPEQGVITFTRTLAGWDGRPLVQLRTEVASDIIKDYNMKSKHYLIMLLMFTGMIIGTFAFFTMSWIGAPLYAISKTLKKEDLSYIDSFKKDKTEFGDVSRLIDKFFKQREEFLKEITQRKDAERKLADAYQKVKDTQEQLIQTSKMAAMGQLAAGISHELNQPLTGIKGFAQTALMALDSNTPLREDLNNIVEQADRMDKIVKNIRFFARKSEFEMKELDINQPIEDSLMLLSEQLKVHNIRLKKELDRNLPRINGDANQLQQVFLNLITNARDAIDSLENPDGGEIIVKVMLCQDKKNIKIIFEDTGCGIPGEDLGNIFNPFFTTKSPDGGIGLGLSIVYRIVENHRGSIRVESELSKGATFKIILPIAQANDGVMVTYDQPTI